MKYITFGSLNYRSILLFSEEDDYFRYVNRSEIISGGLIRINNFNKLILLDDHSTSIRTKLGDIELLKLHLEYP